MWGVEGNLFLSTHDRAAFPGRQIFSRLFLIKHFLLNRLSAYTSSCTHRLSVFDPFIHIAELA